MHIRRILALITLAALAAGQAHEPVFVHRHGGESIDHTARFVVFSSHRDPLTGVERIDHDIWLLDRGSMTYTNLSIVGGVRASDMELTPAISGTGRYVAFVTGSSAFLGASSTGPHVVVVDRSTGAVDVVSRGVTASDLRLSAHALSDDGRYVAFGAYDHLTGQTAPYLVDRATRRIVRLAEPAPDGWRRSGLGPPVISDNGRVVAFDSFGAHLPEDDNGEFNPDVYAYLVATGRLELVSRSINGSAPGGARAPAITSDGRFVAFASNSPDLGEPGSVGGIYVKDRLLGSVASIPAGLTYGGFPFADTVVEIDGVGRFVAFSPRWGADGWPDEDVYVWDRNLDAVSEISRRHDDSPNFWGLGPLMSRDGRLVLFTGGEFDSETVPRGLYVVNRGADATVPYARVNFQPSGAPVPSGHLVDSGRAFGSRGNGFTYGWSATNTDNRDRNDPRSPDQRYDTLVYFRGAWEFALPNGTYDVHVACGDPTFPDSVVDVTVEGRTIAQGALNGYRRWVSNHRRVVVTDGRLTLRLGPTARNVKICFLDIHRVTTPAAPSFAANVNFQPAGAPVPGGYVPDYGRVFGPRGNGLTYGWNRSTPTARDRNDPDSPDQRWDTLIMTQRAENPDAVWEMAVRNGPYEVRVVAGDPSFADSVYDVRVEGEPSARGTPGEFSPRWFDVTIEVQVRDGRLTVRNGPASRNGKLCFLELIAVPTGPG